MSEHCVREVKCDPSRAEVKRYKHIPDMVDKCKGFNIFRIRTFDRGAINVSVTGDAGIAFHGVNP